MAPNAVHRNSQELSVESVELGQDLIVEGHLVPAHRAPVGWIKSQDHRPASQFLERQGLVGRDVQSEIRRRRARRQNLRHATSVLCAYVAPLATFITRARLIRSGYRSSKSTFCAPDKDLRSPTAFAAGLPTNPRSA